MRSGWRFRLWIVEEEDSVVTRHRGSSPGGMMLAALAAAVVMSVLSGVRSAQGSTAAQLPVTSVLRR